MGIGNRGVSDSCYKKAFPRINFLKPSDFAKGQGYLIEELLTQTRKDDSMGKVIVNGFDEEHKAIVEMHTTPGMITDLIGCYEKMCNADIYRALEDIRRSAENDLRRTKMYAKFLREGNEKRKQEKKHTDFERELVKDGINTAKMLIEECKDMRSAIVVFRLCKYIAGDSLELKLIPSEEVIIE